MFQQKIHIQWILVCSHVGYDERKVYDLQYVLFLLLNMIIIINYANIFLQILLCNLMLIEGLQDVQLAIEFGTYEVDWTELSIRNRFDVDEFTLFDVVSLLTFS